MSFRVLIPTAGTGSRLGDLTRHLNKSLVTIANQPVLAYLIEQFPTDSEFVIALGHKGYLVREFLTLAYPQRRFLFVEVEPFEGPGSGLGLTVLKCREFLREPFVFCSCDTLVDEPIPLPENNWMGHAPVEDIRPYRKLRLAQGQVSEIAEKGVQGPNLAAYIGLAGIKEHEMFWDAMASGGRRAIREGEAYGMKSLLGDDVQGIAFTWWDTGNKDSLAKAQKRYNRPNSPNILNKPREAIWFVKGNVIKFSTDPKFIRNRVLRETHLSGFCPPVIDSTRYMYKYQEVEGQVLSEAITLPLFKHFLDHSTSFWQLQTLNHDAQRNFYQTCLSFYRDKTKQRVQQFYRTFQRADGTERINGVPMPTLAELLANINWDWLSEGLPGRYHGDFHFENVLWSEKNSRFTFLDWRQEFGGSLTTGDIYYDLAKILHGLIVCHELITHDLYEVEWHADEIRFSLLRRHILVECERQYMKWIEDNRYDRKKVVVLTAIIYLNIAALHHYPYCLLLYALGKSMLHQMLRGMPKLHKTCSRNCETNTAMEKVHAANWA